MDPAEVTQRPISRMTPRHDLDAARAATNRESDNDHLSRWVLVMATGEWHGLSKRRDK